MMYREIIAVCSQIRTNHINTLCGQSVVFLKIKPGGTYSKSSTVTGLEWPRGFPEVKVPRLHDNGTG